MTSHNLVIDASVAVKWFSREDSSEAAERLLKQCFERQVKLYAPDLLICEVGNALWKGKRLDEKRISESIKLLINSPIEFIRITNPLVTVTVPLMCVYDITFYDAVYIGLAKQYDIPLLSANPKDHQKVKEVEVIHVNQLS